VSSIQRWNPNEFKDKVEQRIKEAFVELIPEEAFKEMVSGAIDNFTKGKVHETRRNNQQCSDYIPSGLERLVEEMLRDEVRTAIRSMLAGDEWRKNYEGVVGEKLAELVHKATPAIIQEWVTTLVTSIMERAATSY